MSNAIRFVCYSIPIGSSARQSVRRRCRLNNIVIASDDKLWGPAVHLVSITPCTLRLSRRRPAAVKIHIVQFVLVDRSTDWKSYRLTSGRARLRPVWSKLRQNPGLGMDRVSQVSAETCENYMGGGGWYFTGQRVPRVFYTPKCIIRRYHAMELLTSPLRGYHNVHRGKLYIRWMKIQRLSISFKTRNKLFFLFYNYSVIS